MRLVASGEATDSHAGWALAHVVRCPDGPEAIAARWRAAEDRREALHQLGAWNLQIRDQRIADAVIAVARDGTRPANLRLLALRTLAIYFDPSVTGMVDLSPRLGTEPPAADMPERVYALIRELAVDANPAIARAARLQWQELTDARPSAASPLPGTVTLENVCGAKFRITNHSDIDLSVELATTPERPARGLRLAAHATRELGARDTGAVRLVLTGGKELASAHSGPECR